MAAGSAGPTQQEVQSWAQLFLFEWVKEGLKPAPSPALHMEKPQLPLWMGELLGWACKLGGAPLPLHPSAPPSLLPVWMNVASFIP